jgi:hypothetical protein
VEFGHGGYKNAVPIAVARGLMVGEIGGREAELRAITVLGTRRSPRVCKVGKVPRDVQENRRIENQRRWRWYDCE